MARKEKMETQKLNQQFLSVILLPQPNLQFSFLILIIIVAITSTFELVKLVCRLKGSLNLMDIKS